VCVRDKEIGPTVAMILWQAPSVVFRKEEISAVSCEISAHNDCNGGLIESWDIAAIPLDEEIGRGPIQC
jgi:hypothetical protein